MFLSDLNLQLSMSWLSILLAALSIFHLTNCDLVPITTYNHDEIMRKSRLTFVAFTASWCPYSRNLIPSFTEAAIQYKSKYPERKTVWGNVEYMEQPDLGEKYRITKFPTMKVFFYGYLMTEYRGSRQVQGLIEYVEKMENATNLVKFKESESLTQWQSHVDQLKGTLILWFPRDSPPFELILKAIALIHDQLTVVVPIASNLLKHEQHKLWFSLDGEHVEEFNGNVANFVEIVEWVKEKSAGMVRELTYENAEEVVEFGKPILILFRKKGEQDTDRKFVEAIRRELNQTLLSAINPLLADSEVMINVLRQFNRDPNAGPFLLADQFRHSFPAPWTGDEIFAEGNIKKFVVELLDDTLHKNLHAKLELLLAQIMSETEKVEHDALEYKGADNEGKLEKKESVFQKLKPAKTRYSFAKQEL